MILKAQEAGKMEPNVNTEDLPLLKRHAEATECHPANITCVSAVIGS